MLKKDLFFSIIIVSNVFVNKFLGLSGDYRLNSQFNMFFYDVILIEIHFENTQSKK